MIILLWVLQVIFSSSCECHCAVIINGLDMSYFFQKVSHSFFVKPVNSFPTGKIPFFWISAETILAESTLFFLELLYLWWILRFNSLVFNNPKFLHVLPSSLMYCSSELSHAAVFNISLIRFLTRAETHWNPRCKYFRIDF